MPAKGRRVHVDERAVMFVGTRKGVFIYEGDFDRDKWKRTGPYIADQEITSIAYDHRDGKSVFVATAGAGLHRTRDLGRTWEKVGKGLPSERVTHVTIGHLSEPGAVWVGTEPASLAKSRDEGDTFKEVPGLARSPFAPRWRGRGSAHPLVSSIVVHPDSPQLLHVSVREGGVYRTEDEGETWTACNQGIAPVDPAHGASGDAHRDVLRLVSNPARSERLYAVAHRGVFRTDDGGDSWHDVSAGLSSPVTPSIIVSPSKPGTVFVVPHAASSAGEPKIDGELLVFRSTDGGDHWERLAEGLPERVSASVLPEAMVMDTLDDEGLYFATSQGHIFVSTDEGETWEQVATGIPPVLSIEVVAEPE